MTNTTGKRIVVFTVLACVVALLSYRFFFPGYLPPFGIYHQDHYIYQGMGSRGYGFLVYFERYPRPIAHVLIDLCGRLGPYFVLAPVFFLSFLNAALVASFVERVQDRKIGIVAFLLFSAVCFANPELYVHIKADPFSAFALTFLLTAFHLWKTYADTGRRAYLVLTSFVIALLCLTKESYFASLGVFLLFQAVSIPRRRVAASILILWSALWMGYALHRDSTSWVIAAKTTAAANTYATSLAPPSLLKGLVFLSSGVLYPTIIVVLAGILTLAWFRSRAEFSLALFLITIGIASWLPNASLPHHLELQYSCLGIFFVLAPLLLAPQLIPAKSRWQGGLALAGAAFYLLTLQAYEWPAGRDGAWVREQEENGRNIVSALQTMKIVTKPGETCLVSGITATYNPFRTASFITAFFGHRRFWTVVIPENVPESTNDTTRTIHASNPARLEAYSHWFEFSGDNRLVKEIDRPTPAMVAPELTPDEVAVLKSKGEAPFGTVEFYAAPNPIRTTLQEPAQTTLHWKSPVAAVEVRIGTPDGKLFAAGTAVGEAVTGRWVAQNMRFYLQDATWGQSTKPDHTLATLAIRFSP